MGKRVTLVLMAAALLFGCGGGGSSSGGGNPEQTQSFQMGLVRGDLPTTAMLSVTKPFYPAGTVELADAPSAAFQPAAGSLPMSVAGGHDAALWVTFAPPAQPAAAPQQGTIRLLFRSTTGGEPVPVTLQIQAQVETPSVRITDTLVSAGNVAVGETVSFGFYVENTSAATPVTVSEVTPPDGEFSIAPDAFPLPAQIAPGSKLYVRLRFAPEGEWHASSTVHVLSSAAIEPLEVPLTGTGIAARVVTDYGYVPLDPVTFESEWLTLDVPPEGVGILLEAWGDPASVIDLIGLEGPPGSGVVYENSEMTGPLGWITNYPAGGNGYLNVVLPNSDLPAVRLVSGGGAYRFRLRDSAFAAAGLYVRAMVSQRSAGTVQEGTLDLHVFLADGLAIADRSDPMSDPKFSAVMSTVDAILGLHGVRLGNISFTFMDPFFDTVADEAATKDLLAINTAGLPEGALNLFFVKDMSYGVAGSSGATPGPTANGTPYSGVVVDFDESDAITVGAVAAREIAYYLGRFERGEENVILLPGDAYAVLRHPLLNAGLPQDLLSPPESTNYNQILGMIDLMAPMDTWSGTFERTPAR